MIVDDMKTNLDAMRGILEDEYTVILCKCGNRHCIIWNTMSFRI